MNITIIFETIEDTKDAYDELLKYAITHNKPKTISRDEVMSRIDEFYPRDNICIPILKNGYCYSIRNTERSVGILYKDNKFIFKGILDGLSE